MLKRLISLNSTTYGKAIIRLDDCDSIQLVGPNNVGKSTLIFSLNFLFIIDGKKMTFVDNKTGDKDTVHHYLPSPVNSYMVFEIFKHKYYCILLKRNNDGEIEYYRFDHEYQDDLFLKKEKDQQVVLKFDDLKEKLSLSGIELYQFRDKREVFSFVYQRGRRNDGVVWLEDSVVSDGLSNNFSKIYRYLINSKLINNKTLKEALIVADNRDKECLNFSQKSKKDIHDLIRLNNDIKVIAGIQKDFFEFREYVNQYNAQSLSMGQLIHCFNKLYTPSLISIETKLKERQRELDTTQVELNEELIPKKQKLDREIGGKDEALAQALDKQKQLQAQVKEIDSFDDIQLLTQQFANLDEERKVLEANLTRSGNYTAAQIKHKITELKETRTKLEAQIKGYANQLIHKLTDKQKDKEMLNAILSTDFSSLSSKSIKKKISKTSKSMKLFDGEITLPADFKGKSIPSINDLKEELAIIKKEQADFEKLLPTAVNQEKAQKEFNEMKAELDGIREKISKINTRGNLVKLLNEQKHIFKEISGQKEQLEKGLKELGDTIARKSLAIPTLTKKIDDYSNRIEELHRWKEEIERILIAPIESESNDTLNELYDKINVIKLERENLKVSKDRAFDHLKYKTNSVESDEAAFIRFVEDEIACLKEKRNSIETLLQAISTQFANPAHILLKRFAEFKEFINNKFNSKLSKTSISDIESLKITLSEVTRVIEDLKRISSIQEFSPQGSLDFDQSENLKTLNTYLDSGKAIEFEDLFDIDLHLTKDGKEKRVDLKEQVESTGTDIMIRLVIIMSVINRLAIDDTNNKITIAIDEIARIDGKNRLELFKFCKEHNFIPICTSTEETILDGFDKYVLLFRPQKGKKINISERYPNVITQDKLEINQEAQA